MPLNATAANHSALDLDPEAGVTAPFGTLHINLRSPNTATFLPLHAVPTVTPCKRESEAEGGPDHTTCGLSYCRGDNCKIPLPYVRMINLLSPEDTAPQYSSDESSNSGYSEWSLLRREVHHPRCDGKSHGQPVGRGDSALQLPVPRPRVQIEDHSRDLWLHLHQLPMAARVPSSQAG